MSPRPIRKLKLVRYSPEGRRAVSDQVAIEEPLEIRLLQPGAESAHSLAVTMRTPGHDFELCAGFLFGEGLLRAPRQVRRLGYCGRPQNYNLVQVYLSEPILAEDYARRLYVTSSCGICGKASLELVEQACLRPPEPSQPLRADWLRELPERLQEAQADFAQTGGGHASGLFRRHGELLLLREDVGRHNALDKVVGRLFLDDRLPARDTVLVLSGRASFELVQKAVMAGIPAVVALGAPSSLAVSLAERFGLVLVGFLKSDRFNVYVGAEKLE